MLTIAWLLVIKKQELTQTSINRWTDKQTEWNIHTKDFYTVIKKNELQIHTARMNLTDLMLNKNTDTEYIFYDWTEGSYRTGKTNLLWNKSKQCGGQLLTIKKHEGIWQPKLSYAAGRTIQKKTISRNQHLQEGSGGQTQFWEDSTIFTQQFVTQNRCRTTGSRQIFVFLISHGKLILCSGNLTVLSQCPS